MANSDIAQALTRLQGVAEQFISATTNRSIQLGREKEARMSEAYRYMVGNEEEQITQLEGALDLIETNLYDKGVRMLDLPAEHRTINGPDMLTAAGESTMSMLNVQLQDSQDYKTRLESRKREADKVLRHINLLDDFMQDVDPAATGDPYIMEASDVATHAIKFLDEHDEFASEVGQRLEFLETETELQRQQEDYYARRARETEQKVTGTAAEQVADDISLTTLAAAKKETQEGVGNQLPMFELRETYGTSITMDSELVSGVDRMTGEDLKANEIVDKKNLLYQERRSLGALFYPWIKNEVKSVDEAAKLQSVIMIASGVSGTGQMVGPNYGPLLDYLKIANAKYKDMNPSEAEGFKNRLAVALGGIDISDEGFIAELIRQNAIAKKAEIKEGKIWAKRSYSVFQEDPLEGEKSFGDQLLLEKF